MNITLNQFELIEALVPYFKKKGIRLQSEKVGEMSLEYQILEGEKWITKHAPMCEDSEISISLDAP
tara:strand:+ start:220 stop:417 length:198 start_codon:yes stop_codon:yes gene_type:complete